MLQMVDLGTPVDLLTKQEVADALAEDARLRAIVAGVKQGELFLNSGTVNMGANTFTSTGSVPQAPAAGYLWAVMNIGIELSAASNVRLYKGTVQPATPTGGGRVVAAISGSVAVNNNQFAKGQFTLKSGDVWSLLAVTPAANILSVFMAYIEVPAERQGELWL